MITVSGRFELRGHYSVELDITEEEFDAMTTRKQNELLDSSIDWEDTYRQAELSDIEVDEVSEVRDTK